MDSTYVPGINTSRQVVQSSAFLTFYVGAIPGVKSSYYLLTMVGTWSQTTVCHRKIPDKVHIIHET